MRFSAVVPILLASAALVLTFLCLFAGSSPTFLDDYALITLNTSQVGQNSLNSSFVRSNPELAGILTFVPESLQDRAEDVINSVARQLGLRDYYSAHILNYCEGFYEPGPLPNATLPLDDIKRNTTYCSPRSANFQFDPREALQRDLNASGHGYVDVSDLNWPSSLDDGLRALHAVQKATFIIYCVSVALIALATIVALGSFLLSGRLSACLNMMLSLVAFLAIGIASAMVTAIAYIGVNRINDYSEQVGVQAQRGSKFLALSWTATAAMILASVWWLGDCIVGRRNKGYKQAYAEKPPY